MVFFACLLLAYLLGRAIKEEFGEDTPLILVALPMAAVLILGVILWVC